MHSFLSLSSGVELALLIARIIATWHTLHHDEERLEMLYPQSFGLVIVDECHGAAAPWCVAFSLMARSSH